MAGKDDLANAVLGESLDYLADIGLHVREVFYAPDEEKVWKFIASLCT